MKRRSRHASLFTSILLLGACQQIIGLGEYEKVDEQEEGGGGGKGGATGGSASGGKAGKGGSAGSSVGGASGRGGGSAGRGGTGGKGGTSGDAGEAGMGAEGGTGGSTGGKGGSAGKGGTAGVGGSSGAGGSAGKSACVELVLEEVARMEVGPPDPMARATTVQVAIQQQLIGSAEDYVSFEFFAGDINDGQLTGSFDLGTGVDDNYSSCSRCVLVDRDAASDSGIGNTRFYATSGTMDIDDASEQMDGRPSLTITDVTLVEVDIDPDTYESTPVDGGDCYHIDSYTLELPTPSWTCARATWGDNICDCGCSVPDLECLSGTIESCQSCTSQGSCAEMGTCYDIDFTDNTQCAANNPVWDCPTSTYLDGSCSCGCGSTDPDCPNDYVGACDYCNEAGSCDGTDDCSGVTLDDNSTCTAGQGWNCTPTYYYDGSCDCGCGIVDVDCVDANASSCDYCGGTGSCGTDCTDIDPDDNSQCI